MKQTFSLSAMGLKLLACLLMLIDHIGMVFFPQIIALRLIGRLAFPIFAFQIAQGYLHTKNVKRYALRLAAAALLSEIPFDMAVTGQCVSFSHQNVMFTLLFGLLACLTVDRFVKLRKTKGTETLAVLSICGCYFCIIAAHFLNTDYGIVGVLTVLLFYATAKLRCPLPFQLAGMLLLHGFALADAAVTFFGITVPVQGFAILALLPIAFYDGKKGSTSRWIRYAAYLFYPLHLLIIALLA